MPLLACPGCKTTLRVPRKLLGSWVECPRCRTGFAALSDERPTVSAPESRDPPPVPRRSRWPLLFGITIVALLIAVVMLLAWTARGRREPSAVVHDIDRVYASSAATTSVMTAVLGFYCCVGLVTTALLGLQVYAMAFVAKDARDRSIDNHLIWVVVVFLAPLVGLIVYLMYRPQDSLVPCPRCGNRKLPYIRLCPHCRTEIPDALP